MKTNLFHTLNSQMIALAMMVLLLAAGTGCRTAPAGARAEAAARNVSQDSEELPAAVGRAFVAYVHSQPGEPRLKAVDKLMRTLDVWAASSVESTVHDRLDWIYSAMAAQSDFDSATNQCVRAKSAEAMIHFLGLTMSLKGWQPGQLAQLQDKVDEMERSRDQALFELLCEDSASCIKNREDYADAIKSLEKFTGLCQHFAVAEYWNPTERDGWARAAGEFENLRVKFVAEFQASLAGLENAQQGKQRIFVNSAAVTDCRAARNIRDAQNDKHFNWGIFGHFLDEPSEFAKAMGLLDRVLEEDRVDYAVKLGASTLRAECNDRLGQQGQEIYARMGSLPGYNDLPAYPNVGEDQLRKLAEAQWREKAKPQPLILGSEEQPKGGISLSFVPAEPN